MEKAFTRTLDVTTVEALVVDIAKQEFLHKSYEVVGIDHDDENGMKDYVQRHNPGLLVGQVSIKSTETVKYSCTLEDFLKVAKRTNK